ncbi:MAG: serine hydrolase domain-containing protein [Chitinophagaceae bacterium]
MIRPYFCRNGDVLKKILYVLTLSVLCYGCNTGSSEKVKQQPEDSLQYYPPTPGRLSQQDFRRYLRELTAYFDKHLPAGSFNGGILVAKEGHVLFEKYTGFANLRTKDTLTDSTSFHIASVSKTFTAIAVLRLAQEQKLSLSDSVQRFFPGLPYPGVTVKTLLNHRSGIPNYIYFMDDSKEDREKNVTNADVLQQLYTEKPARNFKAGTRFSYSNTNFVLLALIVEKLSGLPFPQYMQQTFFGPLQMRHTYVYTPADSARVISSFTAGGTVWDNDHLENTYGDKNIYSTPSDLLKWDQALYTDQLVGRPLLDSAFTPYSLERPSVHNYGLGFRLLLLPNGKKVIYHFGRWHGFNAVFARLTAEKATIIILGNRYNRGIYLSARKAYEIFSDYGKGSSEDEEEADTQQNAAPKKAARSKSSKKRSR